MIVDRSVLNGLQVVAEGYKIFNYDWTANYGDNYCYADKDGKVEGVDDKTAYKDMPEKLIEYFKSLPEFNAEIFTEITGIEVEEK